MKTIVMKVISMMGEGEQQTYVETCEAGTYLDELGNLETIWRLNPSLRGRTVIPGWDGEAVEVVLTVADGMRRMNGEFL